ncbi:MAG TPA: sulfurtransferase TusA family protein [Desulfobacteraceae bacterium]|nr:sulfurtransferase TusA family protein [Desulfobacteraceae bacterium]
MKTRQSENIIVYDIRGQICPSCLLFALREVNELREALKEGRIEILIKTDNRDATSTIPDAVSSMGYDCSIEKKEGFYEIRIRRPKKQELPD